MTLEKKHYLCIGFHKEVFGVKCFYAYLNPLNA